MKKTLIAAVALVTALSACSAINSVTTAANDIHSILQSDTGKVFISALGTGSGVTTKVSNVVTTIDHGISSKGAQEGLRVVCYSLPWAQGALDLFGPAVKISADLIADVDASVKAFEAGPCTTPPVNLIQVLADGTLLYANITQQLSAGGVPVAVPRVN